MIEIDGVQYEQVIRSSLKAIRAKCLDCVGGLSREVKLCTATKCPIHPYRFGHRPRLPEMPAITEGSEDCDGEE